MDRLVKLAIIIVVIGTLVNILFHPYTIHINAKIRHGDVEGTLTIRKNCFFINCLLWKWFYVDDILDELEKRGLNYTDVVFPITATCYKGWELSPRTETQP